MSGMNTLLFTLEYPPFHGGVANYYKNLVKYWPKSNIFVLQNNKGQLINSKLPFLKWIPSFYQLWKNIRTNRIDHVIVGHILPLGTVTYLISKLLKIEYSVILHGMDFSFATKNKRKKFITRIILSNSQNIICANSYTADLVKKLLGSKYRDKISVVNPGICKKLRITNYELRMKLFNKHNLIDKVLLLTVGRFVKRKGIDMVLESLPEVLKKIPNLVYVIIGKGDQDQLSIINKKCSILNLKNNVIIITDSDDEERDAWYELADIFIMAARNINGDFEGFGIVYLEANMHKLPVIAGASGGVRDAVMDGVNGLLVDPNDVSAIGNAIIKLARDENLKKKLGEQGYERAIKDFKWKKQITIIYNKSNKNKKNSAVSPT